MTFETTITSDLFREAALRYAAETAAVVAASAERVEKEAKSLCPVGDSGAAQGSIHVVPVSATEQHVVADSDHSAFLEYGTGARGEASTFEGKPAGIEYSPGWPGMRAQPHMTPAAEAERPRFEAAIAEVLR